MGIQDLAWTWRECRGFERWVNITYLVRSLEFGHLTNFLRTRFLFIIRFFSTQTLTGKLFTWTLFSFILSITAFLSIGSFITLLRFRVHSEGQSPY